MSSVEQVLIDRGLLAPDGTMTFLSREVESALDGFIEDPSELSTLLQMGRTARNGGRLSPASLSAAHLLAKKVHRALSCRPAVTTRTVVSRRAALSSAIV
jgi:hypothetical protein